MQRESLGHDAAVEHFVAAVVAFSDDPGPANLERYLRASRSLDESRSHTVSQRKRVAGAPCRVAQGGAAAA
jgi:hypothetical protein